MIKIRLSGSDADIWLIVEAFRANDQIVVSNVSREYAWQGGIVTRYIDVYIEKAKEIGSNETNQ